MIASFYGESHPDRSDFVFIRLACSKPGIMRLLKVKDMEASLGTDAASLVFRLGWARGVCISRWGACFVLTVVSNCNELNRFLKVIIGRWEIDIAQGKVQCCPSTKKEDALYLCFHYVILIECKWFWCDGPPAPICFLSFSGKKESSAASNKTGGKGELHRKRGGGSSGAISGCGSGSGSGSGSCSKKEGRGKKKRTQYVSDHLLFK